MATLSRFEENMRWLEAEVAKLPKRHTYEENMQWLEAEAAKLPKRHTFEENMEWMRAYGNGSSNRDSSILDLPTSQEIPEIKLPDTRFKDTSSNRTLLIKIHQQNFSISWEVLDQLFSRFGVIEYMEVFAAGEEYHSGIRFQNKESAIRAIDSMNYRHVYYGCCRLELSLDAQTSSRSSETESLNQETDEYLKEFQGQVEQFNNSGVEELPKQQVPASFIAAAHMVVEGLEAVTLRVKDSKDNSAEDNVESDSEFPNSTLALISDTFESSISASNVSGQVENGMVVERIDLAEDELDENCLAFVNLVTTPVMLKVMTDFGAVTVGFEADSVVVPVVYNMLDKMPNRGVNNSDFSRVIFDPGIGGLDYSPGEGRAINQDVLSDQFSCSSELAKQDKIAVPFDRGRVAASILDVPTMLAGILDRNSVTDVVLYGPKFVNEISVSVPFDRGRACIMEENQEPVMLPFDRGKKHCFLALEGVPMSSCIEVATNRVLVFDPGGIFMELLCTNDKFCAEISYTVELSDTYGVLGCIWIFDPGGILGLRMVSRLVHQFMCWSSK